jgi:hypothetical protein
MNARTDIAELVKAAVGDAVKSLMRLPRARTSAGSGLGNGQGRSRKALGVSDRHLSVVKYGKNAP